MSKVREKVNALRHVSPIYGKILKMGETELVNGALIPLYNSRKSRNNEAPVLF